ncbi:AraC family transcriptional regulator [Botryobacter ruber]|uniref:AraC family transcriptional regulator n=1 Tax=Botryobacter ruber TaxID=2171629 RepID=UPI000E0B834A|nr:AraC family transcriptional regulator [Botryobacter ruber]
MKPQLLKVSPGPSHSFSIRQDRIPCLNNRWHYHPEVELIHINTGTGMQFVGDSIRRFESGDIVLIGASLPHYWRFDDHYLQEKTDETADIRVAHFCENFWGDHFLELPENKLIKTTLEKAKGGIQVRGSARQAVGSLLEEALQVEGPKRIILLMEILDEISRDERLTVLSSVAFKQEYNDLEGERMNRIYDFSLANFRNTICLKEIAAVANMSHNSFCRYFKSRTQKTYSQFVTEIRVGHACRLLIENRMSIKQICYESGFHNVTSFHKYFKSITGKSPLVYQKEFLKK